MVKRMDIYKVKSLSEKPQRILLPLSLGPSSLVLLNMLDRHLRGQMDKTGRVGYELHVLHIDDTSHEPNSNGAPDVDDNFWEPLRARYPRHTYYRRYLPTALQLLSAQEINILTNSDGGTTEPTQASSLPSILSSLASPTSRSDILLSLHRRLLAHTARELSCSSIALGHTSTRLAELVLSETSKGRGASLPSLVGESASLEGIRCVFPARELMRGELEDWIAGVEPGLAPICAAQQARDAEALKVQASSRDTTIDQLMTQYFRGVEASYPSIVANVVRTTARLREDEEEGGEERCALCRLSVGDGRTGLTGWGGDQAAPLVRDGPATGGGSTRGDGELDGQEDMLCYGCARTMQRSKR